MQVLFENKIYRVEFYNHGDTANIYIVDKTDLNKTRQIIVPRKKEKQAQQ